jgi:hypothetical protein
MCNFFESRILKIPQIWLGFVKICTLRGYLLRIPGICITDFILAFSLAGSIHTAIDKIPLK